MVLPFPLISETQFNCLRGGSSRGFRRLSKANTKCPHVNDNRPSFYLHVSSPSPQNPNSPTSHLFSFTTKLLLNSGGFQVSSSLCYLFLHMTGLHYMGAEVKSETLDWTLHFHSQFQVVGADWLLDFSNVGCDYKFKAEICGFSISCCGCGLATQFIKHWV